MKKKLIIALLTTSLLSACFTACNASNPASGSTENTVFNTASNVVVETEDLNTDTDDSAKEIITETSKFYSLDKLLLEEDRTSTSSLWEKEALEVYIKNAENRAKGIVSEDDQSLDYMGFHFERDGDFIWAMYGIDSGMSRTYYLTLRSKDGGNTWEIKNTNEPYICGIDSVKVAGSCVAITYGGGMFWSLLMISTDYGDTFQFIVNEQSCIPEYYFYVSDCAYAEIVSISPDNNSMRVDWYSPGWPNKLIASAEMSLNLKNVRFSLAYSDIPDLLDFYQDYLKTGFYFANSAEDYLDKDQLYHIFKQMYYCDYRRNNYDKVLETIRYAINEIYARKGYDFTGTKYEEYFNNKDWYHPITHKKITEEELNSYEKANIDLLVEEENKYKGYNEE